MTKETRTKGRAMMAASKTKPHEDKLREVPESLAALLVERRSALSEVASDTRFTEEHRDQAVREINERAIREVRAIREGAETRRDDLREITSEMASPEPQGSAEEQLLREVRLGRMWNRYRDLLEAGTEPSELIRRAEESQDEAAVGALSEELPSYLEARGWNSAHLAGVSEALARIEEPYLTSEQSFARRVEARLSSGWSNLEVAFAHAEGELDGTFSDPTAALPAYEGGMIPVEDIASQATEAG